LDLGPWTPHASDAWIDTAKRDPGDGLVGYETTVNHYFYRHTPPRPLEDEIRGIERDIPRMLAEMAGWPDLRVSAPRRGC
jgi:hypothetical protein